MTSRMNTCDSYLPLKRDVKLLGHMLGNIITQYGGKELFEKVESIRKLTKSLREEFNDGIYMELKKEIEMLTPSIRKQIIRAFSIYFHLINAAELNHRIRRRRAYQLENDSIQSASFESALLALKENDIKEPIIQRVLDKISLELIITAHPTEAMRRSILEIQKRICRLLKKLDSSLLTKKERKRLENKLMNEISILWHTDELRHVRPSVMDEVQNGLYYFDHTFFDVLPGIHQDLEEALKEQYPNYTFNVPNFLYIGSWIGGDRDGNPNVTPDITWKTLVKQRALVLKKYTESLKKLMDLFSHSVTRVDVSKELIQNVEKEETLYLSKDQQWSDKSEVYRRKINIMVERLKAVGKKECGYQTPQELLDDLYLIQRSMNNYQSEDLKKLIRQVQIFGFHLATLDIRNHSREHEKALSEILQKGKIVKNYQALCEEDKTKILKDVLDDPRPVLLLNENYSKETKDMMNVFHMIKKAHDTFGQNAILVYLVSMTKSASDLLEVLVLAKEAGIYTVHADGTAESHLNVAPLLETVDDLIAGPKIMETLFTMDIYRNHLKIHGNTQEIMLGYSDGSKDGGTLTANWRLYKAQLDIHSMASLYHINLKFFHGRGGSLGRGGGPLTRSILSQPAETFGDGIKITEQGEVLSSRYLIKDIAYRSLEQATSTLLEAFVHLSKESEQLYWRKQAWEKAMEEISDIALRNYQSLVFHDPDFLTYFTEATPLNEIGEFNIGSRPMKRNNRNSFEDLRAIPWVFAWTQSRQLLPAWYASGTGLCSFASQDKKNLELLQNMYKKWPFFRSTIDNLQMALMKADITTAKEYKSMVKDEHIANKIFNDIMTEYETTKQILLKITKDKELLDHTPNIKESVHYRNPYVDTLNYLQVELLKQYRNDPNTELLTEVLLTINGIAAGLRNTG